MTDAERTEPKGPRRPAREQAPHAQHAQRAQLAQLRERVWSGFASEDVDLVSIVEPLSEVLAGEVFVVSDLRRIGSPLVHVEPGFERLTGYAPQVAIGRELGFLLRNDTDQDAVRQAREAVREGNAIGVTLRNYRADGSLFWCEQRHHPVRDERGRVAHLVTVLRDVTDQVHAYGAEQVEREQ
ncbi:MAG: PAS domain-containing protein, partial [Trueperaceae bacterium]